MKIALAQIAPKLSPDNQDIHESIVREVEQVADVVVFPELSLNGNMLKDAVWEDAFLLGELTFFEALSEKIDIVVGAITKEEHKLYNSLLYYSRGQLLNLHHKKELVQDQKQVFSSGDVVKTFMTPYGKAMTITGDDLWSGEILDAVSRAKPAFLYVMTNAFVTGFDERGVVSEERYRKLLATAAMLAGCEVIFVNRVGFEDGRGYWGGSQVVDAGGRVRKSARLFEKEVLLISVDPHLSYIRKYLYHK
ncbi:MAG: nitrilase [Sulfurospirillum sp.]|nr:MAG: nitrilase [Sulfurospirillum sp.]